MDDNRLNRSDIDAILEGVTARDLFDSVGTGREQGGKVAGAVFEAAAKRQGYGELALDRIGPKDAVYLSQQLGELFDTDGPKAEGSAS